MCFGSEASGRLASSQAADQSTWGSNTGGATCARLVGWLGGCLVASPVVDAPSRPHALKGRPLMRHELNTTNLNNPTRE